MPDHVRFDDGAAYERSMGVWSQLAGNVFLDWLAPASGWRWLDVGCGNGAFTELIARRCSPAAIQACDPSEAQLHFARHRPRLRNARIVAGDALNLPYDSGTFDIAVMALVVVFLSPPARGIAEMTRAVRPGGLVASYVWDMLEGGFPLDPIVVQMREMGLTPPAPRQMAASRNEVLLDLWTRAGLKHLETHAITVRRSFADFEEYWSINASSATIAPTISALGRADVERIREGARERLHADSQGRITCQARANAIKGFV